VAVAKRSETVRILRCMMVAGGMAGVTEWKKTGFEGREKNEETGSQVNGITGFI
jgi:hypothetical protein